jgi:peptidoglycan/LPS O-acetylase OafA/YrhL
MRSGRRPEIAYPRAQTLGYQPALDGVRAVAILLVLFFHAFKWPGGGFLGVHVFFVLSGFLITTLLLQEWEARGSISLRRFYRRRALRLVPALVVVLVTYAGLQTARAVLLGHPIELSTALKGVTYCALYLSNIAQAAGVVLPPSINHLWSLATEEQFYVLWPLALLAVLRFGGRRPAILALLLGLIAAIAIHRAALGMAGADERRMYYAPDTTFDVILVGCLFGVAYVLAPPPRSFRARAALRWGALAGAAVILVAVLVTAIDSRVFNTSFLLPFSLAVGLVVYALAIHEQPALERALSIRPAVYLGRISYSLYLWHPMVLLFAADLAGLPMLAGTALALVAAAASYRFVEQPFLRRKGREQAPARPEPRRQRHTLGEQAAP